MTKAESIHFLLLSHLLNLLSIRGSLEKLIYKYYFFTSDHSILFNNGE